MKARSAISIIGLALALTVLFTGLPAQAQAIVTTVSIENFRYDGVDSVTGQWKFSWDTVPDEDFLRIQVKGGGVFQTWYSVNINNVLRAVGKTHIRIAAIAQQPDTTLYIRLRLRYNNDWLYAETSIET